MLCTLCTEKSLSFITIGNTKHRLVHKADNEKTAIIGPVTSKHSNQSKYDTSKSLPEGKTEKHTSI